VSGQLHPTGEELLLPIELEAQCASDPLLPLLRIDLHVASHPARSHITLLIELH
jgi:hypothetical protein